MKPVYSDSKIFNYPKKIQSLSKEVDSVLPPIHIRLKPFNACNHNCDYCAYRNSELQLGSAMDKRSIIPRSKMLELINDFKEMSVEAITLSGGGEPLLYPHIVELLSALAKSKIQFAAITNGSVLTQKLSQIFASSGRWIRVSIDGWDDASYSDYRCVSTGEFTKVIENIKYLSSLNGQCTIGASIIVDHRNYLHLDKLTSKLADAGVQSIKVSPCIVSNNGEDNNKYIAPFYDSARGMISKLKVSLQEKGIELYDAFHLSELNFKKDYNWCPYSQILPVIGADQVVYSCIDKAFTPEGKLGSIENISFQSFWNQNKNMFFRINPSCDCNHHCVANGKNKVILNHLNADPLHNCFV